MRNYVELLDKLRQAIKNYEITQEKILKAKHRHENKDITKARLTHHYIRIDNSQARNER